MSKDLRRKVRATNEIDTPLLKIGGVDKTSDINSIGSKVPSSRTINGQDLSTNRTFTQDDIGDGTTNKQFSATNKNKLSFITVTQNVDLDDIETRVNGLDQAVVLKGTWDASTGVFPGSGIAQAGYAYINTHASEVTIDGIKFNQYDRIVALLDNASTTVYSSNWLIEDFTDKVVSVDGQAGAVSIVTQTITDGVTNRAPSEDAVFDGLANAKDRANHTGTQTASTISDFNAAALAAAPAETATTVGGLISGATEKTTPVDADKFGISDSAASNVLKYLTFANLKAAIKSYIDSLTTTFTNKRITPRVSNEASNATPSINTDNFDAHEITDLAVNASITLSGTPTRGQRFRLSIKDNNTSRSITWPSNTEDSSTVNRPTTTTASVRMDVGFVWDVETSKWRCIAVA